MYSLSQFCCCTSRIAELARAASDASIIIPLLYHTNVENKSGAEQQIAICFLFSVSLGQQVRGDSALPR